MFSIRSRNVNTALPEALRMLKTHGIQEETRNGSVLRFPRPLHVEIMNPRERVLTWHKRDANPFFHLMEFVWMMAGRNDLEFLEFFNSKFGQFSDDGKTIRAAYGHRWRSAFDKDQLAEILHILRKDPKSRRAVLAMWDVDLDLAAKSVDQPCNLSAVFKIENGGLNMHIMNRSNDLIWGMFGANVVHFSMLQEWMANCLNVPVGVMTTYSVDAHAYLWLDKTHVLMEDAQDLEGFGGFDPYADGSVKVPIFDIVEVSQGRSWQMELQKFFHFEKPWEHKEYFSEPFFLELVIPMYHAWYVRKHDIGSGLEQIKNMTVKDWGLTAAAWIGRREKINEY